MPNAVLPSALSLVLALGFLANAVGGGAQIGAHPLARVELGRLGLLDSTCHVSWLLCVVPPRGHWRSAPLQVFVVNKDTLHGGDVLACCPSRTRKRHAEADLRPTALCHHCSAPSEWCDVSLYLPGRVPVLTETLPRRILKSLETFAGRVALAVGRLAASGKVSHARSQRQPLLPTHHP